MYKKLYRLGWLGMEGNPHTMDSSSPYKQALMRASLPHKRQACTVSLPRLPRVCTLLFLLYTVIQLSFFLCVLCLTITGMQFVSLQFAHVCSLNGSLKGCLDLSNALVGLLTLRVPSLGWVFSLISHAALLFVLYHVSLPPFLSVLFCHTRDGSGSIFYTRPSLSIT